MYANRKYEIEVLVAVSVQIVLLWHGVALWADAIISEKHITAVCRTTSTTNEGEIST
jgi:hypothetical protein